MDLLTQINTMGLNELAAVKADAVESARKLSDKLGDPDFAASEERTAELNDELDKHIAVAEACKAREAAINEARKAASDRAARIDALGAASAGDTRQPAPLAQAGAPSRVTAEPRFVNDPMKGFANHAEFIHAVGQHGDRPAASASDERLRFLAAAGTDEHQTGSDPYGGFLVPIGMAPGVETVADEGDLFGGAYAPTPLSMDSPIFKVNAVTDKNHTSSVTGGLTVSRSAETAAKSSSRTQLEQVTFNATSVFGLAYATEEQLSDSSVAFASFIASQFSREFTSNRVQELMRGSGVGEPEGYQNSPALVTVAKEGSQTADTINGTNIVKMRARCWGYSEAIWIANIDTYPQLVTANIAGTNSDYFLFSPGNGTDVPDTLLGRPIMFTEYAETLGDLNDIALVNPKAIYRGVYQPLASAESVHVRFLNHERAYKFWTRDDARSLWRSALTPNKGASTLSPFVNLAARA